MTIDTEAKVRRRQRADDGCSSAVASRSSMHYPVLLRVEEYLDLAPRYGSEVIRVGFLVLFASHTPWAYYARPNRGNASPPRRKDLVRLRRVCKHRELPLRIEWIAELSPELENIAAAFGLRIARHPLLILTEDEFVERSRSVGVRMLDPDDGQLIESRAVVHVVFDPTMPAAAGVVERDARLLRLDHAEVNYAHQRARSGRTVTGVASVAGVGVVATGSYNPIGEVAEIVGVGTLPTYRHQGLGSDVVHQLCEDAFSHGVQLIALVAEDEGVARMYQRLGFRRIGTCMSAQDCSF